MKITIEKTHILLFHAILFWIFSGMWLQIKAEKSLIIPIILLVITGLISNGFKYYWEKIKTSKILTTLMCICLYIFIIEQSYGGMNNTFIRAFNSLFVLFLFSSPVKYKQLLIYLSIGVSLNLLYVLYSIYFLGIARPVDLMNPNSYAPYFGMLFTFSVSLLAIQKQIKKEAILLILLSICSLAGVFLLGSRGIYLAAAMGLLTSIIYYLFKGNKHKFITLSLISLVILSITYTFQGNLNKLYKKTSHEYHLIEKGNLSSSIGQRIQMYSLAIELIKEKPLLGWGDEYKQAIQKKYDEGKISKQLLKFNIGRFHNVFLDVSVKNGVIPILAIIFFIFSSARYFYKNQSKYSLAGLNLIFFGLLISMFDTALQMGPPLILFLVLLLILYHLSKRKPHTDNQNSQGCS